MINATSVGWQVVFESHTTVQTAFLVIGYVILGLITISTYYQAFSLQNQYMGNDEMAETEQSVMDDTAASVSLAGWVTSVGFFHYLCLYQGYGTVMLGNGEEFAWITYIEFVITTPIILMNIASLIHAQNSVVVQLVVFDILMILAGFCASISTKVSWRYIWYVISFCYFVAIFSILFHQAKLMDKILGEDFRDIAILYRRLLVLTTVTWSIYPILFVFGPNGSIISGGSITEVTTVLDIFSKGLSGLLLSFAKRSLNKAQDRVAGIEEESSSSCFGLCHEEDNRKKQAPQIDMSQQQMQMLMQMLQLQQQQMMQMPQSPASQYGTPFMPQVNPMTELISPTAQGALPMLPPLPSLPSPTKQFQEPAEPQQQQPEQPQQQQQQQQQQMHSVPQVRVLQPQIPSPDLKSSTPTSVADGVLSPASENKRQTSLVICVSAPTDKPPLGRVRSGSFSFQQESRAESQSRVIAMEITDPSHPPDQQEAARLAADADARRLADQQKAVEQKRQADQKAELEAKRLAEQRLAEQRETQRRMAQLAEEQQRAELAQKQRQEELKRQEEQKRQEEIRRQAEVQAVAEAQARRLMEQKLAEQKAAEKAAAEKAAAEKAAAEQAAAEKAAAEKAIAERLAQQRAAEADAKRFADETAAMLQRSTAAKIAEASKVQQEQAFQQQMQMQQMQMQPQMAVDPMQAMQQQFNALAAAKLGASSPPSNYADSPKTSMSMPMINQSPKTNIIPQSPRSSSMSTLTAAPVSAEFQKLSPAAKRRELLLGTVTRSRGNSVNASPAASPGASPKSTSAASFASIVSAHANPSPGGMAIPPFAGMQKSPSSGSLPVVFAQSETPTQQTPQTPTQQMGTMPQSPMTILKQASAVLPSVNTPTQQHMPMMQQQMSLPANWNPQAMNMNMNMNMNMMNMNMMQQKSPSASPMMSPVQPNAGGLNALNLSSTAMAAAMGLAPASPNMAPQQPKQGSNSSSTTPKTSQTPNLLNMPGTFMTMPPNRTLQPFVEDFGTQRKSNSASALISPQLSPQVSPMASPQGSPSTSGRDLGSSSGAARRRDLLLGTITRSRSPSKSPVGGSPIMTPIDLSQSTLPIPMRR